MATQNQNHIQNIHDVDVLDVKVPMFRVLLYNDDYTTFDFVIMILREIFHKTDNDASRITMQIHKKGKGIAGIYPREIAEMKVSQVHQRADASGFPLRAGIEENT